MFLRFLVQGVSLGLPGTLPRCKSDAKGRKIESPSACCGTLSGPLWLSRLGARKVTTKSCYPGAPWGLTSVIGDPGLFLFGVTKRNKATTTKTQFGILCGTPPLLPGLDFWFLMLCCVSFVFVDILQDILQDILRDILQDILQWTSKGTPNRCEICKSMVLECGKLFD